MSDGPKRPPWRPPRQLSDDEVVEIPPTSPSGQRPSEPFRRLAVTNADITSKLDEVLASHREILGNQRKTALIVDGLGNIFNQRMDVFHKELAMLRATVTGDHAPRLDAAEKEVEEVKVVVEKTKAEKAKAAAVVTARFGAWGSGVLLIGGMGLRALAKLYPEYGELIESALGWFGI